MDDISACIVGYARVENIQLLISKLNKLGISRIYLYLDGAKDKVIKERQDNLIEELIRINVKGSKLIVKRRKSNWGASVSVIKALDDFFATEQFGLILEDDLDFDEDFIKFVRIMRPAFLANDNCWILSGSNLIAPTLTSTYINYPQIWGWATSAQKWTWMKTALLSKKQVFTTSVPLQIQSFWKTGHRRAIKGFLDVWDLPLACAMLSLQKLTVLPPVNLVSNLGNDAYATHTGTVDIFKARSKLPRDFEVYISEVGIARRNSDFEKDIFKIKFKHILSYPKCILSDSIFKKTRGDLLERLRKFETLEDSI